MSSLLSVIPIVVRRVAANARLLAAVVIGAVLAAALMSTTSIYTRDAIRDLGLSYAIRQRGPDKINMQVRTNTRSSLQEGYEKDRDFIDGAARNSLGPRLRRSRSRLRTRRPSSPPRRVPPFRPPTPGHAPTCSSSATSNRTSRWSGRLPRDASPASEGGPSPAIEAALGGTTARRTGAKVGDRFDLHPFWAKTWSRCT